MVTVRRTRRNRTRIRNVRHEGQGNSNNSKFIEQRESQSKRYWITTNYHKRERELEQQNQSELQWLQKLEASQNEWIGNEVNENEFQPKDSAILRQQTHSNALRNARSKNHNAITNRWSGKTHEVEKTNTMLNKVNKHNVEQSDQRLSCSKKSKTSLNPA
jgi:hypothetical protein